MIITDQFVYIHPPKTGGSFVNSALLEAHGIEWSRWRHLQLALKGEITLSSRFGPVILRDKHGPCKRIPAAHGHKPVLSTIRNPFDYYVSDYEFGWWKRREWRRYYQREVPDFGQRFPAFPDISFPDYLQLMSAAFAPEAHKRFDAPEQAGYFTVSFIRMFFKDPDQALARLDRAYLDDANPREDMYPVRFITTKALNRQLYDYLIEQGYPEAHIRFILEKKRVLPLGKGRSAAQKWEQYYTPELQERIRAKDRMLFRLFPLFDTVAL